MVYVVRVALVDYDAFLFLNDHNIVNFPLAQESNGTTFCLLFNWANKLVIISTTPTQWRQYS